MQQNADDFELVVKRFIRRALSGSKPRDIDFTVEFIKKELSCLKKWISNKIADDFYKRYRLGIDTFEPLYDKKFYRTLTVDKFPTLFKEDKSKAPYNIKKRNKTSVSKLKKESDLSEFQESVEIGINWEGFKFPPTYTLIDASIPIVRKAIMHITKRYIAIMELESWISKNGLVPPQIDEKVYSKINLIEDKTDKEKVRTTIERHLNVLKEENRVDDFNFNTLTKILVEYFTSGFYIKPTEPVRFTKTSKTRLSSALGSIYRELRNGEDIPKEYYELGKENIYILENYQVPNDSSKHTKMYKYFNIKFW